MIKKLRHQFILVNMLLVTLVLLIVFGVLVGSTYQRLTVQGSSAMRMALEWGNGSKPPNFEIGRPQTQQNESRQFSVMPVFSVTLDKNGNVVNLTGTNISVSDEVLAEAVSDVLASENSEGTISSLALRYVRQDRPDGTHIAFLPTSWQNDSLFSLVGTSLLVGAGALVCFFFISLFLSALALRPVKKAWEQQRQFVADASHELRTPLTVMLTNSSILLSHPESTVKSQAKWVEYIQTEAQRMKGLVEDLLFLAKSDDARAVRPVFSSIQLSELVTGCLLPFESVAFENDVNLESEIAPGLTLIGSEAQLRRLAVILLDNACKYAGQGGTVMLRLFRSQEHILLSVNNTGEPIAPEHLPHLFERFYRTDSDRARATGGFGLGLAIAKSIVETHHGTISVASDAQSGTTFTVSLPVDYAEKRATKHAPPFINQNRDV